MPKNKEGQDSSSDEEERPAPPPYQHPTNRVEPQPITYQPGPVSSNNIIINSTPNAPVIRQQRLWSTGIFGCFSDCGVCCYGLYCPFWQLCQIATDMGESCCLPICVPTPLLALRIKMRIQENIQGSILDDWFTTCCFPLCAQCQLAREIKYVRMHRT